MMTAPPLISPFGWNCIILAVPGLCTLLSTIVCACVLHSRSKELQAMENKALRVRWHACAFVSGVLLWLCVCVCVV